MAGQNLPDCGLDLPGLRRDHLDGRPELHPLDAEIAERRSAGGVAECPGVAEKFDVPLGGKHANALTDRVHAAQPGMGLEFFRGLPPSVALSVLILVVDQLAPSVWFAPP